MRLAALLLAALPATAADPALLRDAAAALQKRDAAAALAILDHVSSAERDAPEVALLRMEAFYLSGNQAEGDGVADRLATSVQGDARLAFSAGMALARASQYVRAEAFLSTSLAASPGNFSVLYNLGVAATFAGHPERASEVLEAALRQQPRNVDVLYGLAYAHERLKQPEPAARLLAQAAQIAPQRADICKLLAIVTGDLGAYRDALTAWDRYLKLEPGDAAAQRERSYTQVLLGKFEEGIAGLQTYAVQHPTDAVGLYELGLAVSAQDPTAGLDYLNQALAANPAMVEAYAARGSLHYRQGKPEAALPDLEFAAARRGNDSATLDRLGQTYLALDRPADAVRVLRQASAISPGDSTILLHLGRALADAGHDAESKAALERFRSLGPARVRGVPAGLVEYLALTPEQQRADYRARVERAVQEKPEDAGALVHYLELLLQDGAAAKANETARAIRALKPGAAILGHAGRVLLEAGRYDLALQLLSEAVQESPTAGLALDAAVAAFQVAGPAEGLKRLNAISDDQRDGDYFLARAQMLDAGGQTEEAAASFEQALRLSPARADVYRLAAAHLLRNGKAEDAVRAISQAARALPQNRDILLSRATALGLAGDTEAALRQLNEVQNRWPEWPAAWVARGLLLGSASHFDEANAALETAITLGAHSAGVRECLRLATLRNACPSPRSLFLDVPPRDW